MEINKLKKIFTNVSLACMGIAVLMLIASIFGLNIWSSTGTNILLTLAVLAVASFFCINALNVYNKSKKMAKISIILLLVDSLAGIILFWIPVAVPQFIVQAVAILSITTVFFVICVSNNMNLGNRYKVIQLVAIALIIVIDIVLALLIIGINPFIHTIIIELFAVICLVVFALLCAMKILGRKALVDAPTAIGVDNVVLTKTEYEALNNRIKELEEEVKKLKGENE